MFATVVTSSYGKEAGMRREASMLLSQVLLQKLKLKVMKSSILTLTWSWKCMAMICWSNSKLCSKSHWQHTPSSRLCLLSNTQTLLKKIIQHRSCIIILSTYMETPFPAAFSADAGLEELPLQLLSLPQSGCEIPAPFFPNLLPFLSCLSWSSDLLVGGCASAA